MATMIKCQNCGNEFPLEEAINDELKENIEKEKAELRKNIEIEKSQLREKMEAYKKKADEVIKQKDEETKLSNDFVYHDILRDFGVKVYSEFYECFLS